MMLIATRTKDQRIKIKEAYEKKYKTVSVEPKLPRLPYLEPTLGKCVRL